MDVLVYHPSPIQDISATLSSLRALLAPFYAVQSVTTHVLATHPWAKSCALLLLLPSDGPGDVVNVAPKALDAMQFYVEGGGRIIALGFGASVSHSRARSDILHFWESASSASLSFLRSGSSESPVIGQIIAGARARAADVGRQAVPLPDGASHIAFWATDDGVGDTQDPAAVKARVGRGEISLWNFSFIGTAAPAIRDVLKLALVCLGLFTPDELNDTRTPDLPPVPNSPLPQFLLSPPSKTYVIEAILQSIGIRLNASSEPVSFKDAADTFSFHFLPSGEAAQIIGRAREVPSPPADSPRDVLVLPSGMLPPREATPRFDTIKYFTELNSVQPPLSEDQHWRLGEALFYSEAVTSTQTLLERNPLLLSSLSPPIVSVASFQLAGRGRGSNIWLSPEGCLQFSVHLRLSLSTFPAPRLVFVQYLFGLAVVSACKDSRALGGDRGARVRLKWPNDIYVELDEGAKKAGGILVNTSFMGGKVDLIIGCGVNVSTPSPVASLSRLSPGESPLRVETMLSLILVKFEGLWNTFVEGRGSWVPFEDMYLDAWLHSDQLVTLTTVSPPQQVRILGITPDHGLLRTLPEAGHGGYIDLQPDGNSFDLMEGLIKAKR